METNRPLNKSDHNNSVKTKYQRNYKMKKKNVKSEVINKPLRPCLINSTNNHGAISRTSALSSSSTTDDNLNLSSLSSPLPVRGSRLKLAKSDMDTQLDKKSSLSHDIVKEGKGQRCHFQKHSSALTKKSVANACYQPMEPCCSGGSNFNCIKEIKKICHCEHLKVCKYSNGNILDVQFGINSNFNSIPRQSDMYQSINVNASKSKHFDSNLSTDQSGDNGKLRLSCDKKDKDQPMEDGKSKAIDENYKLLKQMRKLKIKEEKRIKREEEMRRKIVGPKSQYLKIIDHSIKDKITAIMAAGNKNINFNRNEKSETKTGGDFKLNQSLSEFPDLDSNNLKQKNFKSTESKSLKQDHLTFVSKSVDEGVSGKNDDNTVEGRLGEENICSGGDIKQKDKSIKDDCDKSNNIVEIRPTTMESCKKKKKVKKSDPIVFNIVSTLELLQVLMKKRKLAIKSQAVKAPVTEERILAGNLLDSDCPTRNEGKHRESRIKKHLSRLKRIILNEWRIREQWTNESKLQLLNFNKLVFDEMDRSIIYRMLKTDRFNNRVGRHELTSNTGSAKTSDSVGDDDLAKNGDSVGNGDVINNNNDFATGVSEDTSLFQNNYRDFNKSSSNNETDAKILLHSRKFRYYCDQWPDKEMNENVHGLIKTIVKLQDQRFHGDPNKAQAKRLYVCGFHEVSKYVNIKKAKLVIIATDIDCSNNNGGMVEYISQLTKLAETSTIPCVFCGSRWSLKYSFKKKSPISCAAILDYTKAKELYKSVIDLIPRVKQLYKEKLKEAEITCGVRRQDEEDVTSKCIRSMLDILTMKDNENGDEDEENPFMSAIINCCPKNCDS